MLPDRILTPLNGYFYNCNVYLFRARAGTIIGLAVNLSGLLAVLVQPYMPKISEQMQSQLAFPPECFSIPESFVPILAPGHKTGSPVPLFQKMDPATAEEFKKRFAGKRQVRSLVF